MSRFLSLKVLAIDGSKSRAVTRIRAAAATGSGSNLVRHFSLSQALGVTFVEPKVVDFNTNPPPEWDPNDPNHNKPAAVSSIAVILSGCGMKDGTDVQEFVYTMMHISRNRFKPMCFAPEGLQSVVVDHINNQFEAEPSSDRTDMLESADHINNQYETEPSSNRNIMLESARLPWGLWRSYIAPLDELKVEEHQGLIIPGGMGIGSDYYLYEANKRLDFWMEEELNRTLLRFYWHRKPMGFLGVASLLAARVFQGVRITFGDEGILRQQGTDYLPEHVRRLNAVHEDRPPNMIFHDTNYNIFSAPGFLAESSQYHLLSSDIGKFIDAVLSHTLTRRLRPVTVE